MEFFDLFNVPMMFMEEIINFVVKPDIQDVYDFSNVVLSYYLFAALGALGVYVILLIFGGIGLSKLAKKQGLKHRWMGFLPFFNTYYAGKLAGETQFFGQKMKRIGLYAMLTEILYVVLQLFLMIATVISYFPQYRTLEVDEGVMTGIANSNMPAWLEPTILYGNLVAYLIWFFVIIFFCVLFIAFFRKYYARGPILLAFLSAVLPFRGITIFAVRNNAPVDYNDYIRRRTQAYMRSNGYSQPPYGPYGPQSGPQSGPQNGPDPFEGFGSPNSGNSGKSSSDDDPFSEFDDPSKKS
ncbi:MAG: hypothetical protein DBX60_05935 [Bacillota bacterium]|nr:MAG: hypothetical protein DBX60_05935 [Bacillota bacterium]